MAGPTYDAMVHTIFLGFAFSMVFAHAPVIVPAVLGVALPFRRAMYGPLVLLHAGLVLRLLGDWWGELTLWQWGGVLDETAILTFLALAAWAAVSGRRGRRGAAGVSLGYAVEKAPAAQP